MAFENGGVSEDWWSAVIIPLYKGKGERNESKNYRGIRLLSVVGKIYAATLEDRLHRVTGGLIARGTRGKGDCVETRVRGLFNRIHTIYSKYYYIILRRSQCCFEMYQKTTLLSSSRVFRDSPIRL